VLALADNINEENDGVPKKKFVGIAGIVLVMVGIIGFAVFLVVLRKKRLAGDEGWPHCEELFIRKKKEDGEAVHELLSGVEGDD